MNIYFTYNVKTHTNYSLSDTQEDIEFDSIEVINDIANTITRSGHKVTKVEANENAYNILKDNKNKIDLVFNIAEGIRGDARESQIPLFCEMLNIPYTHSSPTTHALKLNKHLTKEILRSVGVKSPKSIIVEKGEKLTDIKLKYPLIVKPNKEGSSKGIFNDSVARNDKELKKAVQRIFKNFGNEALIEEYIDGRELTVGLLGSEPKVLPVVEQRFDFLPEGSNKVAGYETKWLYEDKLEDIADAYYCPAKLSKVLQQKVEKISKKIWNALNVKDCARIDYRVRGQELFFIEINTIPGINPDPKVISYFPLAVRKAGMSFDKCIDIIIKSASKRFNIETK